MNLGIEVITERFNNFVRDYNRRLTAKQRRALSKTAQEGVNVILARTEQGRGYNGRFAPYSPKYAKAKRDGWQRTNGRQGFGGDSSGKVNLMVHGTMLSSIITEVRGRDAFIKFSRAEEAKKAEKNNRTRPFFGFNRKEKRELVRFYQREVFR